MDLAERVERVIRKYGMLAEGEQVLAALSGGADSVCMAAALHQLGYRVHAVHVHHGLRSQEADRDAAFCEEWCRSRKIPFSVKRVHVEQQGRGIENAAREARYAALREEAERLEIARIAVAHHQRDQAETVLLHLMRGSALAGLCAMEPVRADGIIRPLLFESREQIEQYCEQNGLSYVTDSTNAELLYTRNAVRLELLPMMERIRPGSVQAIVSCAELLRRDHEALAQLARTLYADAVSEGGGFVRISCTKLVGQPQALASRVLLQAIRMLRGSTEDYFSVHIDSLTAMLGKEGTGDELSLPGGIFAQRCYDELWLFCRESLCTEETVLRLGANRIGRWKVHTSLCAPPLPSRAGGCEYIDAGALAGELVLRTRRDGDWLFPLGSGGRKKLKDYFIDKKVPRPLRDRMLLLCSGSEVLAVLGMCVGDRVKVTERTKEMLCLKFSETEKG